MPLAAGVKLAHALAVEPADSAPLRDAIGVVLPAPLPVPVRVDELQSDAAADDEGDGADVAEAAGEPLACTVDTPEAEPVALGSRAVADSVAQRVERALAETLGEGDIVAGPLDDSVARCERVPDAVVEAQREPVALTAGERVGAGTDGV